MERMDVIVAGTKLGTADGWDEAGDVGDIQFYKFKAEHEKFRDADVMFVSMSKGTVVYYDWPSGTDEEIATVKLCFV